MLIQKIDLSTIFLFAVRYNYIYYSVNRLVLDWGPTPNKIKNSHGLADTVCNNNNKLINPIDKCLYFSTGIT